MNSTPRALLFDLDGVLVRSGEIWFRTLEEAGRRFRGRPVTREEFFPTFGQGTAADVVHFGFACTSEELDRFYAETFPRHGDELWVDPDAARVLEAVRERGATRALVTNTVSALTAIILGKAGLQALFESVNCAGQVPRAKPAPDLLRRALQQLGVGADEAWMIGDSRYDREAAKAAGVRFIGLHLDGDARIEALAQLLDLFPA
jgi:phosphoglycolate phosphatase/AHBA synthesis associated protein